VVERFTPAFTTTARAALDSTRKRGAKMIQFLVHDEKDSVGVATVDIKANVVAQGLTMDTHRKLELRVVQEIPLGHKVALKALREGDTVIEYAYDIGKVVAPIQIGQHVHVHNLKTKRW
jgi:(2R)-sulfolactate sulfo-lyase subunit alpha